jgi:alkanesulfonate monooxygenase SsuD/methylene tetrahydromethanopterin reductase-like flavin-dependent oxidoreductase (luciferase family)
MKFGIFDFGWWHEVHSQADIYRFPIEQAALAEELGYDQYWIGEHHFSRHGVYGDPFVLAGFLAARTTRLRIGTAVIVLPLHNPVTIAERAAMVDVLSNGRFDLGVGNGYQRREFTGLGMNIDEARGRFEESLDVILACWKGGILAHEGKYFHIDPADRIEVIPQPVQKPHPPIYRAVATTPASVEAAARRGIPIMVGGPTDIMGAAPQVIELWRSKMCEFGNDPAGIDLPCSKLGIYVAPTDAEAEADMAAQDLMWDVKLLAQDGMQPTAPRGQEGFAPGYEVWESRIREHTKNANQPNRGGPPLIGSPETVAERVKELRATGVNNLFATHGTPGMPLSKVLRSVELFGKHVIPELRATERVAVGH